MFDQTFASRQVGSYLMGIQTKKTLADSLIVPAAHSTQKLTHAHPCFYRTKKLTYIHRQRLRQQGNMSFFFPFERYLHLHLPLSFSSLSISSIKYKTQLRLMKHIYFSLSLSLTLSLSFFQTHFFAKVYSDSFFLVFNQCDQ